jgi:uncharacterized protein YjbI with pentapeptide repeats
MNRRRRTLTMACALVVAAGVTIGVPGAANAAKVVIRPTGVQVVPLHTALAVSWTAPANTGGQQIDGYIVTATLRKISSSSCIADNSTSCAVAALVNGDKYSVTVMAAVAIRRAGGIIGWVPIGKRSARVWAIPTSAQNCSYFGNFANLQGCNLSNMNLSNDLLDESDMAGTNLTNANLSNANLAVADLQGATLTGTILSGAFFNATQLTGDNLSGADLHGADFYQTTMSGLDLSSADLSGSIFNSGNLTGTNLTGANLTGASVGGSTLINTMLSDANLTGASFGQDNLTGADFSGAILTGVIWNFSICPDGTNSSSYSPQTCIGHGI